MKKRLITAVAVPIVPMVMGGVIIGMSLDRIIQERVDEDPAKTSRGVMDIFKKGRGE